VRLDNVYETNISSLRSYDPNIELPAYNWRLDENSYHKLMTLLSLEAHNYPSTDSLRSVRKTHNASIPICAAGPTATEDLRNAYLPPIPGPTAPQNLLNARVPTCAPVRAASSAPQFHQNSAVPARQLYGDVSADLAIQNLQTQRSPPNVNYSTTMELPPPTPHRNQRRESYWCCLCKSAMAFLFCLCLVWLLVGSVGWLIRRKFGI
jgi:hypothetical protein